METSERDSNTRPPDVSGIDCSRAKESAGGPAGGAELQASDWLQIGKGVRQDCILSPCLFNLYAEYIMRNAGLDEA